MPDKSVIRREVLRIRDAIKAEDKKRKDEAIFKTLTSLKQFKEAKKILFYVSFGSEVDTRRLIEHSIAKALTVAVPKVVRRTTELEIYVINGTEELVIGSYGIPEPSGIDLTKKMSPTELDLIVVPGVAFDENRNRLGYGKGYYDKLLAPLKALNRDIAIALSYEEQIVGSIPSEPHDIKMDMVITDERTL